MSLQTNQQQFHSQLTDTSFWSLYVNYPSIQVDQVSVSSSDCMLNHFALTQMRLDHQQLDNYSRGQRLVEHMSNCQPELSMMVVSLQEEGADYHYLYRYYLNYLM